MALVLLACACGPTVFLDEGTESSSADEDGSSSSPPSTSTSTSTSTTTPLPPVTSVDDTAGPPTITGPGPDPTATDTSGTCGAIGELCIDGVPDCCSGSCSVVGPLGGVCSECENDGDCRWGCTPSWPLDGTPAVCNDGGVGAGCQTSAACQPGLVCEEIVNIPGILTRRSCGLCSTDLDCPPGLLCGVMAEVETLGGFHACIPPGTVPPGQSCDLEGSGAQQCSTGICAPATLMDIPVFGVCSMCQTDADCLGGSCQLPVIDIDGTGLELIPGACV